jgi:hypothetical protein
MCQNIRVEALEGARDVEGAGSLKGRSLAEGMVDGTEGVGRNRHTQRKWSNSRARRKNFGKFLRILGQRLEPGIVHECTNHDSRKGGIFVR